VASSVAVIVRVPDGLEVRPLRRARSFVFVSELKKGTSAESVRVRAAAAALETYPVAVSDL
jgi:hypothetical protein